MRRILLPLFLLSTAAVSAESLEQRLDVLEAQMQDLRMQSVYGNFGANTASAYPVLDSWGAYFSADAIYWKFFIGGTDYVYENNPNVNVTGMIDKLHYLDTNWRFAYRFTLGYQLKDPDLDLWATFTRFTTDQTKSVNRPEGATGNLFANEDVTPLDGYQRASVQGIFAYNVLDVNLGRNYFLRRKFSVHPAVGIRGAKIDMRSYFSWENSSALDSFYKGSNDFWGLGILGAMKGRWHFDANWSLFGSVLGSLLYGWYDVGTSIEESTNNHITSDTRRLVPNMATDVGVTWEYLAFCERTRFCLTLAYEFQYWWAYNQMLHTKDNTFPFAWDRFGEDFGLQGLKFNFGLDF